jgi:LPS export ABC transporter protein LptC
MILRRVLQKIFLAVPILYLLSLSGIAFFRSSQRRSVVSTGVNSGMSQSGALSEQVTSVSKVQLEEFHRVEVKHGKPIWEIRAKDAKYYPQDFVTHVNGAQLTIFREKHQDVHVNSEAAKLYLGTGTLVRAVLDGNIEIAVEDGLQVKTQSAEFDAAHKIFTASGDVEISGKGFQVRGKNFRYAVDSGLLSFAEDVHCVFQSDAEVPRGISLNGK